MKGSLLAPPALATRTVVARTTGLLYLAGGTIALLPLVLPGRAGLDVPVVMGVGLFALLVGVVTTSQGSRLPRASHHVLVSGGSVLITVITQTTSSPAQVYAYGCLYAFVVIDACFFFAWPWACLHTVGALACWLLPGASRSGGSTAAALGLAGTVCVVGGVVGWLVRVADQVEIDGLTGALNRRGFDRALAEQLRRAGRSRCLTVVMLDLDHFKDLNDRRGHLAGDRRLREFVHTWQQGARAGESIGRFGGDEFALLLPGQQPHLVRARLAGLRTALPDQAFSAGIGAWQPGDSASMVVNRADSALYQAKREGRDRVVVHREPGSDVVVPAQRTSAAGTTVEH